MSSSPENGSSISFPCAGWDVTHSYRGRTGSVGAPRQPTSRTVRHRCFKQPERLRRGCQLVRVRIPEVAILEAVEFAQDVSRNWTPPPWFLCAGQQGPHGRASSSDGREPEADPAASRSPASGAPGSRWHGNHTGNAPCGPTRGAARCRSVHSLSFSESFALG